ncbi:MAG: 4-hydroxy-3-methylbut-2-enyl diphosphate reductase [Gammaproteobacteria bacterium]|nr:MAG: 4-hydroxy-3-methylbut-2-enyl diphosphate reductase [Gammaproteobacteria bacterium]
MDILLANPRGFCAGVDRAIKIVDRALELFGAPVYVRHEVVHNRHVVEGLRAKGAVFVEALAEIPAEAPPGTVLIFSAHGVPRAVREEAARRGLRVFDATCPLVTKVHLEVERYRREGLDVVLVGHAGHPEVEGTLGQWVDEPGGPRMHLVEGPEDVARLRPRDPRRLAYVTQTTLSVDDVAEVVAALRRRFPALRGPRTDDICYATQNRQDAVKALAERCELVLVVGSPSSSNSNRLREIAQRWGARAHLVDGAGEIDPAWLEGVERVGVTAGASAPEAVVQEVVAALRRHGGRVVQELAGREEGIRFSLPRGLAVQGPAGPAR